MKKLAMTTTGALLIVLSGCASQGKAEDVNAAAASAAIEAAEAAVNKARSVDGEWRDARKKYLKKAKTAAHKADFETAIKLANIARFQGEMGYEQAIEQKSTGPWLF